MLKKVLHIVLFLSMACGGMETLHAQHYIGVKGGFGGGTSRFFPKEEMGTVWGLYSGGISWKYYSYERYLGGVEADLLFMQQGYRHYTLLDNLPGDTTTYMEREINSFVLPIFWQPHFYFFQRKVRLYLNLGVTFSYNMNSQYKWYSAEKGLLESKIYHMELTRDNRWGYGLVGGAGIGMSFGRVEAVVEGRYYFGYSDILKNRNKYESNPLRSPLDNIQISAGIYIRLGKGGILAPPSKRVAEKLRRKELERMMNQPLPADTVSGISLPPTEELPTDRPEAVSDTDNSSDQKNESGSPDSEQLSRKERKKQARTQKKNESTQTTTNHGNDETTESSPTDTERHQ